MLKVKLLQKQDKNKRTVSYHFGFDLTSTDKNLDTFVCLVSLRIA